MTKIKKLEIYTRGAIEHGCSKILIDENTLQRKSNIDLFAIFIREDGWSLGCPEDLFEQAMKMFNWIGYIKLSSKKINIINEKKI